MENKQKGEQHLNTETRGIKLWKKDRLNAVRKGNRFIKFLCKEPMRLWTILWFGWKRWENKEQKDYFLKHRQVSASILFSLISFRVFHLCYFRLRVSTRLLKGLNFEKKKENGFPDKESNLGFSHVGSHRNVNFETKYSVC